MKKGILRSCFDENSSFSMNGQNIKKKDFYGNVIKKIFMEGKDVNNNIMKYNSKTKKLTIFCGTKECCSEYEFELENSNQNHNISYTCSFCNVELFSMEDKINIIPLKLVTVPKDEIAIVGCICTVINDYLEKCSILHTEYELNREEDFIEVRGENTDLDEFIVLKIFILHDHKQVQIPNILVSGCLKHNGIGKKIISLIYRTCIQFNYRLFIVDMVESFYNRMLKRGAANIDPDTVEITEKTNLNSEFNNSNIL